MVLIYFLKTASKYKKRMSGNLYFHIINIFSFSGKIGNCNNKFSHLIH